MNIYVDQAAPFPGDGSQAHPFKTISEAALAAMPGDEVLVLPGVYRECVDPPRGGEEQARITYRSVVPKAAVITGAESVKNWKPYKGTTWVTRISNEVFGGYNPYTTEVFGDWYFADSVRYAGAVFVNDRMLYEAESLEDCMEGAVYKPSWDPEFSVYQWFSVQENGQTVIYANFQDKDPNAENVEITVRRRCFFPSKTGMNCITLDGFTVCKAATTWAPPAAFQDGMIGPHWSKGWIIENCEIYGSKCVGISLGKYLDEQNEMYFTRKHLKSPTQMERDAVCRGQYHGWTKENIGSHIIRHCDIHHCEQAGIVGRMGAVFSLIEDNHIHHINNMQQLGGAEISAIKLHAAIDVTIRRNHIHHSTMGVWLDWQAQGARVSGNLLHHNERPAFCAWAEGGMVSQDLFIEVGHGPTLVDNNLMLSSIAIRFPTQGVACVHNLILGGFSSIGECTDSVVSGLNQPRYTPYHIPHRTEVAGFMSILHGDNRFYNNIFLQAHPVKPEWTDCAGNPTSRNETIVGTDGFDEYPSYEEWIARFDLDAARPNMDKLAPAHFGHLPIWAGGNAFLAGAKPGRHDKQAQVNSDATIIFELIEKDGEYSIRTNLYDFLKSDAERITSDTLGVAFEPDQRFENPDGTDLDLSLDYFGNHRSLSVLPGPFASACGDALIYKHSAT